MAEGKFGKDYGEIIPENDPVRVLDAIVEHLDISAIEANTNKYTFDSRVCCDSCGS